MPFLWQSFDQNTWLKTLPAHLIFPPHSHLILPSADGNETSCVLRSLLRGSNAAVCFSQIFSNFCLFYSQRRRLSEERESIHFISAPVLLRRLCLPTPGSVFYKKVRYDSLITIIQQGHTRRLQLDFQLFVLVFFCFFFNCKLIKTSHHLTLDNASQYLNNRHYCCEDPSLTYLVGDCDRNWTVCGRR